jgi:predicted aspartyl protease
MIRLVSLRVGTRAALAVVCALIVLGLRTADGAVTNQVTLQSYLIKHGYEVIPLKWTEDRHLSVVGKINGQKVVFFVDTGAGVTFIDQSLAVHMKHVKRFEGNVYGIFGTVATKERVVTVDRLELGPVSLEDQPAVVVNLHNAHETHPDSLIPRSSRMSDCDALLGLSFLLSNHAIIDSRGPSLFIRRQAPEAGLLTATEQSLLRGGFVPVPLVFTNHSVYVAGGIDNRPATFLLDTGGVVTTVDRNQADTLGLSVRGEIAPIIDASGKKKDIYLGTIHSLRLGDFVLGKMDVAIVDLGAWTKRQEQGGLTSVRGILGPEVLYQGYAIVDCSSLKLFFHQ